MTESGRNTFMAVSVGIIIGVALLVGISSVVSNALSPVSMRLGMTASDQARQERVLVAKIDKLETKIDTLENKMQAMVMAAASAQQGQRQQQPQQPQMDLSKVYDIPVADSQVFGKADAPITVVEFTDMQCPFCSRFHKPLLEAIKAYPDKVKLVLKNFPLSMHPNARSAAKAALAAGLQGKYFEMVDLVLQNQQSLGDEKYKELAGQLKLDVGKFTKDIQDNSAAWDKRFDAETELGGNVGVRGTPTYFLNGKQTMARDVNQWKTEIDAILNAPKK